MLKQYEHGGDIYGNPGVTLDFSVNTNPLGMPGEVESALAAHIGEFSRYPDPHCRALRAAIALHEEVPDDWVLCGNGAADLIYRLCYTRKPRSALLCAPAFSEYERALESIGCAVTWHTLTAENQFALTEDMAGKPTPGTDILFLCNPNNPTGRLISPEVMKHILKKAEQTGTSVVVDECFLDFTDGISAKQFLRETPGLIILKAFTKIYAMAGLRLGYILTADKPLIEAVSNAAQFWSVSVPAQIAGAAALSCAGWIEQSRQVVAEERQFLAERLRGLGVTVFPSDVNYLLLRSEYPLYDALLQKGILIRACENFRGLDKTYFRIGVKMRDENSRLLQAVKEALDG